MSQQHHSNKRLVQVLQILLAKIVNIISITQSR